MNEKLLRQFEEICKLLREWGNEVIVQPLYKDNYIEQALHTGIKFQICPVESNRVDDFDRSIHAGFISVPVGWENCPCKEKQCFFRKERDVCKIVYDCLRKWMVINGIEEIQYSKV